MIDEETGFYAGKLYPSSRCKDCERERAKKVSKARHSDPVKKQSIKAKRRIREAQDSVRQKMRQRDNERYARKRNTQSAKLSAERSAYYQANKSRINANWTRRFRENLVIRLRKWVSGCVWSALRANGGSKRGMSIMEFLPYTIEELKSHIENHSEHKSWMTWDNYGSYDPTRRTWQIDHITPQHALPYDSMEHPNFLKCWGLDNLRPLETIENLRKGHRLIGQ